jgi:hypothetical protein
VPIGAASPTPCAHANALGTNASVTVNGGSLVVSADDAINSTLSQGNLERISFYSGLDNSSFVGTGFQILGGPFNQQIIPVPEPETYATALLLVLGFGFYFHRQRKPAPVSCPRS